MWEAVRRVEQIGLHVVAFVSDGAQPNRKFYRDHYHASTTKKGITYKTPNLFRPGSFIYFISDVPHLLKTTRNAWSNSKEAGPRHLWVLPVLLLVYVCMLYVFSCRLMGTKSNGII